MHLGNLDAILDSLEKQVVPPDFHLSSSSSSLFGGVGDDSGESDNSDLECEREGNGGLPNGKKKTGSTRRNDDRSKWKTLRDFVDFSGIAKATEEMDEDRDLLEVRTLVASFNL